MKSGIKPSIKIIIEITIAFAAALGANFGATRLALLTGSRFLLLLIPSIAMLAAVAASAAAFGHANKAEFNISAPSPRHLIPSGVMGVGGYFIISAVTLIMGIIFPSLSNETDSALYDQVLKGMSPISVIITVVVVPAICEELIFRGFFFKRLTSVVKPFPAMLVSGVIFGAAHFDLYKLLPVSIMGVVFAYIAYKTGSFFMTALLHMVNNAVSVVALYRGGNAESADGYSIVVSNSMALFYAAAYTALGAGLVYIALKLFKTIKLKGVRSKLIIILCAVAFFGFNYGAALSETQTRLNVGEVFSLPDDTVYEASFTLDEPRITQIDLNVIGGKGEVKATVYLTDSKGGEIFRYEGTNIAQNQLRALEAGEYTFRCEVDPKSSNAVNYILSFKATTYYQIEFQPSD